MTRRPVLTGGRIVPAVPLWVRRRPSGCCGERLVRIERAEGLRAWAGTCPECGQARVVQPEDKPQARTPTRERTEP